MICTEKLFETGVKEKQIFLPTIYDKLIAFISDKIQHCFGCSLIYAQHFFFIFMILNSPNPIKIITFLIKSRNTFKQTRLNRESAANLSNYLFVFLFDFLRWAVWDKGTHHK